MLCRMLPPMKHIRYFFSLNYKDEVKLKTDEEKVLKGILKEFSQIIPEKRSGFEMKQFLKSLNPDQLKQY